MKIFQHQRKMAASTQTIFQAWEDPAMLAQWYGPKGFTITTHSFVFQPSGKWEFVMHGPDGMNYPNTIIFQEIRKPNKIVMRHSVEPYFTATVIVDDIAGGATIGFIQEFDSEEVAQGVAHIVQPSNEQLLDKLQAVVEQG